MPPSSDKRQEGQRPVSGADVGERIDAAIKRAGLSQSEVARRLGVAPGAVNKWVRGRKRPEPASLVALARVLGVSVDELLGVAAGQEPPFAAWRDFLATPQGQSLTPAERLTLAGTPFAPGVQPTVAWYLTALVAYRAGTTSR